MASSAYCECGEEEQTVDRDDERERGLERSSRMRWPISFSFPLRALVPPHEAWFEPTRALESPEGAVRSTSRIPLTYLDNSL